MPGFLGYRRGPQWRALCNKRISTMSQFLDHLAEDMMPALIERLSTEVSAKLS